MPRNLIAPLVAMVLTGCAGKLPPVEEPKAISVAEGAGTATIILNRENAPQLGHTTAYVLLDGKSIGTVTNGQCVRLTIPAGAHNLQLSKSLFGNFGGALGHAIAKSLKIHNVKISSGQRLHYLARPVYDGPNTGWLFRVSKQSTGRTC